MDKVKDEPNRSSNCKPQEAAHDQSDGGKWIQTPSAQEGNDLYEKREGDAGRQAGYEPATKKSMSEDSAEECSGKHDEKPDLLLARSTEELAQIPTVQENNNQKRA